MPNWLCALGVDGGFDIVHILFHSSRRVNFTVVFSFVWIRYGSTPVLHYLGTLSLGQFVLPLLLHEITCMLL